MKHVLSKSTYIRSLQCVKSLYLYKYHYTQRDPISKEQQAKFQRGHQIGSLAQLLFPGGIDASVGSNFKSQQAVMRTYDLINQGHKIIYEASFFYNEVWVIADVLVINGFEWQVYEVKSSLEVSDTYLHDAALQYYVISNAAKELYNARISDFSIMHVNKYYRKQGPINWREYFIAKPVLENCINMIDYVITRIEKAKTIITERKLPNVAMGEQCNMPYPCDFIGTCSKTQILPTTSYTNTVSIPNHALLLDVLYVRHAIPKYDGNSPYMAQPFAIASMVNNATVALSLHLNDMGNTLPAYQTLLHLLGSTNHVVCKSSAFILRFMEETKQYHKLKDDLTFLRDINFYDWESHIKPPYGNAAIKTEFEATQHFLQYIDCTDIFKQADLETNITDYVRGRMIDLNAMLLKFRIVNTNDEL